MRLYYRYLVDIRYFRCWLISYTPLDALDVGYSVRLLAMLDVLKVKTQLLPLFTALFIKLIWYSILSKSVSIGYSVCKEMTKENNVT